MKNKLNIICFAILIIGLLTSCGDLSQKAEDKLNELNAKTDRLDSLVNKELKKVNSLDSLINNEGVKVKKLDSIITKSTTKIDSIANSKMNILKRINSN